MKVDSEKETNKLTLIDRKNRREASLKQGAKVEPSEWSNIVIKEAISVAKKIGADAILFYMDSTKDLRPFSKIKSDIKLILLTKRKECAEKSAALPLHTVMIPDVQLTRAGYLKIGFLTAISKGFLRSGDVIVCVGGVPEQGYIRLPLVFGESEFSEMREHCIHSNYLGS